MANNQRPIRPDPTPAEIRAACEALQAGWTPLEEARRRGLRELPAELSGRMNREVRRAMEGSED